MNLFDTAPEERPLRDYQERSIAELRQVLREGSKRPLLQIPTGGGKTRIAGEICRMAGTKGSRVAFCVPALSLIDQTIESFHRDGLDDLGVIQADHHMTDWRAPVQICSVDTLTRRGFPNVDFVIVDEAHRKSETVNKWMALNPKMIFVGLSATPWAKGLGKQYDRLIVVTTIAELIERGYLSDFRVFAPTHPDLTGVKTVAGDYHEGQLADAMSKPKLVADVVETWVRHGEGRPTLCFGVNTAHAKAIEREFREAGVPCAYQDAHTKDADRAKIREDFRRGIIHVVVNIGTLTTGVDWDVRCIILVRPTQSEMLHLQIVGRGLRPADGKADCLILDHASNTTRLGFVTDIHHDALDDGSQAQAAVAKRKDALPKECAKCSFLRPPRVSKCPNCGFKPEVQSKVETADGELKELRPKRGLETAGPPGTVTLRGLVIPHRDLAAMLRGFVAQRGYKSGFASAKYKELVGAWPPREWEGDPTREPCYELYMWLKASQIRWVKQRAKERREQPEVAE